MNTDFQHICWPDWEIVGLIGQGNYGTVYEIRRDMYGLVDTAALKVISIPQKSSDIAEMKGDGYTDENITEILHNRVQNIVDEYGMMRKMNGTANVVNCDDLRCVPHADGIGWDIYIKMELLKPLPTTLPPYYDENLVIRLAKDLCSALVLCQNHGIIHRDIKPQNIFLSHNGDYKLGDFGVSKTVEKTMGGTIIGTYRYMAPEVYNYQPYGVGADIYSLGLVLYWLMNERRMPFLPLPPALVRASEEEKSRKLRFSGKPIPAPAHGSRELKRIVLKACAFDPKDRYQNAWEMKADLQRLSRQEDPVPPVQPVEQEDTEDQPTGVCPDPSDDLDKTVGAFNPRANLDFDDSVREEDHRQKEQNTREEAERRAKEEAARAEAERRAREDAARAEAERKAREAAAIQMQEAVTPELTPQNTDTTVKKNPSKTWLALIFACVAILIVGAVVLLGPLNRSGEKITPGNTYDPNIAVAKNIGWRTFDGNKYYYDLRGVMQTGWQNIYGNIYYFAEDGIMQTGWQIINSKKYYFNTFGIMQTDWQTIDRNKYYFSQQGVMQTGLQTINGEVYYFGGDGIMRTGTQIIDGDIYEFASDGRLIS